MTQTRQTPFAKVGAASSVKRLLDQYNSQITGIEHQGQLTPIQRQILDAAEKHEAEKQRERREEMRQQQTGGRGGGRTRNARAGGGQSGGNTQAETVRYINKQENPDHDVFQD